MQQHQGQQSLNLRLVGHQLCERPPQPDRLGRELVPPAVSLVEDEVDDREHGGQPVRKEMVGRHTKRDPGRLDLALCPHQPLRHGLLRDEEGAGDLIGGQAAEGAQRQSDLRVHRQSGMTAGEDELQALVRKRRLVHVVLRRV